MLAETEVKLDQLIGHRRDINIATGASATAKHWKNETIEWADFVERLSKPTQTQETEAEYGKMPKTEKDKIKDVGGFVGGFLKGGRRKSGHVQNRSLLVLDADSPSETFLDDIELLFDFQYVIYSTHSHTANKPRYRIVIPVDRNLLPDEYEPITRKIADRIGLESFDDTTYQSERLMYWPSHPRDSDYVFKVNNEDWLDPDAVLGEYADWTDASFWPESPNHAVRRRGEAKRKGDPRALRGAIGAFAKAYTITEALELFLQDTYLPTEHDDRWTYAEGSTAGGLVVYEDLFAYSHHGTDPVGDQLVNAFDLVRIHKFGDLDSDTDPNAPINKLPSTNAMRDFANELPAVRKILVDEAVGTAQADFDDWEEQEYIDVDSQVEIEDEMDWLEVDKNGNPKVNHFLLARQVLAEIPAYANAYERLWYDANKGIWRPNAEHLVASYITRNKLQKLTTQKSVNETKSIMFDLSYDENAEFEATDKYKIVLANGVYDLRTGNFNPSFDKKLKARNAYPITYDSDADCPTFDTLMSELVGAEQMPFLYEWIGFLFYPEYFPQKLLFLYGKGGTGKSTLINHMRLMVGKGNYSSVGLHTLMNERFAKASLYNKTANFDADAKSQYIDDGDVLKLLTGDDVVYADRKNREPIEFYNHAKLTFSMNELPSVKDKQGALERRAMILRMDTVVTKELIENLETWKIADEYAGIFNRAMGGLQRVLANKEFSVTDGMSEDLEDWLAFNDTVQQFLNEDCELGEDYFTAVNDLFEDFKTFLENSNYGRMGRRQFNKRMEELGYERKPVRDETSGAVYKAWQGVKSRSSFNFLG